MKRNLAPYMICFAVIAIAMATLLCLYPKGELHLMLSSHHSAAADWLMRYYTTLAEWPLYVVAVLALLFWKKGWAIVYASAEVMSALLTQAVKHLCHMPRPVAYFESQPDLLTLVEGVHMHHSNSFPSGHTATFFVFCTIVALILAYRRSRLSAPGHTWAYALGTIALCLLAALGGYSRIYLSQHFLLDIFVGSLIGVASACFCFWLYMKRGCFDAKWFGTPLIRLRKAAAQGE